MQMGAMNTDQSQQAKLRKYAMAKECAFVTHMSYLPLAVDQVVV